MEVELLGGHLVTMQGGRAQYAANAAEVSQKYTEGAKHLWAWNLRP